MANDFAINCVPLFEPSSHRQKLKTNVPCVVCVSGVNPSVRWLNVVRGLGVNCCSSCFVLEKWDNMLQANPSLCNNKEHSRNYLSSLTLDVRSSRKHNMTHMTDWWCLAKSKVQPESHMCPASLALWTLAALYFMFPISFTLKHTTVAGTWLKTAGLNYEIICGCSSYLLALETTT